MDQVHIPDDKQEIVQLVDLLQTLECELHDVSLRFSANRDERDLDHSDSDQSLSSDDDDGSDDNDYQSNDSLKTITSTASSLALQNKFGTERFLRSIALPTGGSIRSASTLSSLLQRSLGQRIPESAQKKVQFKIAPGLVLPEVRVQLLTKKATPPRLKTFATLHPEKNIDTASQQENQYITDVDDEKNGIEKYYMAAYYSQSQANPFSLSSSSLSTSQAKRRRLSINKAVNRWKTSEIETSTDWFDGNVGLEERDRAKVYQYGLEWIPMDDYGMSGIKRLSNVCITILGYVNHNTISRDVFGARDFLQSSIIELKLCPVDIDQFEIHCVVLSVEQKHYQRE